MNQPPPPPTPGPGPKPGGPTHPAPTHPPGRTQLDRLADLAPSLVLAGLIAISIGVGA